MLFGESVDIGLQPEDPTATRVVEDALKAGYEPVFSNGNEALVEVTFQSPEHPDARCPVLFGWMEKLGFGEVIQTAEVLPSTVTDCENELAAYTSTVPSAVTRSTSTSATPSTTSPLERQEEADRTVRVTGELGYLLHLWSTPHATRALGGGGSSSPDGRGAWGGALPVSGVPTALEEEEDEDGTVAPKGRGSVAAETVDPVEKELSERDDTALVRNAMDALMRCAAALEAAPTGAKVYTYVDEENATEYIKIE